MHRNERRTAREIKRATPVYLLGADVRIAANDSYCLRCGHEGHTASDCKRPVPACAHEWETRVRAERLVDSAGWSTGWWIALQTKTCACCPTFEVERVDGTRARSADEALALYREQQEVSA